MRYLSHAIEKDIQKKMILLAGPRQCGKTTLAKNLLPENGTYLNWDITKDRKVIRDIAWPKNSPMVVLDEIHKAPKWKNYLKGIIDEFGNRPPILVTGSARLDTFRRAGDALTGRFYYFRLHPLDICELIHHFGENNPNDILSKMMYVGTFPEAYFNPTDAPRLKNDRLDLIIREDLPELSRVNNWRGPRDLLEMLRSHVGQTFHFSSFNVPLGVSAPTIKNWIELFEKLYLVFNLSPYSKNISSSLKKDKKMYFFDPSLAEDESKGAILENIVACALLKMCHYKIDTLGENWDLFYVRDKLQREVDFLLTLNKKPHTLIEVKKNDDRPSTALMYFKNKLNPVHTIQLVAELDQPLEKNGIKILPLASKLKDLWGMR